MTENVIHDFSQSCSDVNSQFSYPGSQIRADGRRLASRFAMGGGPCRRSTCRKASREKFGSQVRPERLLKEDLELLEGRSSEGLLLRDSSSEVPYIRRWSEN